MPEQFFTVTPAVNRGIVWDGDNWNEVNGFVTSDGASTVTNNEDGTLTVDTWSGPESPDYAQTLTVSSGDLLLRITDGYPTAIYYYAGGVGYQEVGTGTRWVYDITAS